MRAGQRVSQSPKLAHLHPVGQVHPVERDSDNGCQRATLDPASGAFTNADESGWIYS